MKIISLSGAIGSGKDTAYELLSEHFQEQGLNCQKLSFANKLKDNMAHMFYWDRDRLEWDFPYKEGNTLDDGSPDPACELLGMTRRKVMQLYGTDAVRNGLHTDAWIITMRLDIMNGVYDDVDIGFITDARFMNELKFTSDLGGLSIQVWRDNNITTKQTEHVSEQEWRQWDDWGAIVENKIYDPAEVTKKESKRMFQNKLVNILPPKWSEH